jgi:hypothetical protein
MDTTMAAREPVSFDFDTNIGTYTFTAENAANLNQYWGDIASRLASAGIMGDHSSSHGLFTPDPGDGGRTGVGNLSRDNGNFQNPLEDINGNNLGDGGQGLHAIFQAALLGDDFIPPDAVEAQIGPFTVETSHNVTVTFTPFDDLI